MIERIGRVGEVLDGKWVLTKVWSIQFMLESALFLGSQSSRSDHRDL